MWMSLAPFWIADIRITFTSLMTGASSPCLSSASALISSSSSRTSTSLGRRAIGISRAPCWRPRARSGRRRPCAAAVAGGRRWRCRSSSAIASTTAGLRGHDRLDVVARHELDVVHGEDVGRVRHRDRQRGAGSRLSGMIWYLCAVSAGIELDDRGGSISNWRMSIDGTP